MGGVSDTKLQTLSRLVGAASDSALRELEAAFWREGDASLSGVRAMLEAELGNRRARAAAFAPLAPLCAPAGTADERARLPPSTIALLWSAACTLEPTLCAEVVAWVGLRTDDEPAPPACEDLCARLAAELRAGALAPGLEVLSDPALRLPELLDLAPLVRAAMPALPGWMRTLNPEHVAAVRLAFRDASALGLNTGVLFLEVLAAHAGRPWMALRLISAVMDRPDDRYLAASEMAPLGAGLIDEAARGIEVVRGLDPDGGEAAGRAAADAASQVCAILGEFEAWIAPSRDGPWSLKLAEQRRALAIAVETRLREVEKAVHTALPTQSARLTGRLFRQAPKLNHVLDPAAVRRAEALLAFLAATRGSAAFGGFGALRAKVLAALQDRLATYADDLVEDLHATRPEEQERLRLLLDVAAVFTGHVQNTEAAGVVRRRAAAA